MVEFTLGIQTIVVGTVHARNLTSGKIMSETDYFTGAIENREKFVFFLVFVFVFVFILLTGQITFYN